MKLILDANVIAKTFYDATYVTLALKEGCKLITADERLQKKHHAPDRRFCW